ncbi:OPT-domain-containing protein [Melampsora americana]|nr:OPT-domain-containing protein [Melampsora americana]
MGVSQTGEVSRASPDSNSHSTSIVRSSEEKRSDDIALIPGAEESRLTEIASRPDLDEARRIIKDSVERYHLDPNAPTELLRRAEDAISQKELKDVDAIALIEEIKLEAAYLEETPFPEVRAVASSTDDPETPVSTFRAWFIVRLNVFFQARMPGIVLTTTAGQVLALPTGRFLAAILPTHVFSIFGYKFSLNPGPFNPKEQLLITIMGNVTYGGQVGVYATDLIAVLRIKRYYGLEGRFSRAGFQLLMTLSTQCLGLGLAGLTRSLPTHDAMASVPRKPLNNVFHEVNNPIANGWKMGRYRFFLIVFVSYGLYFVFPDAIVSFLGTFNWMTWISPKNVNLAAITGSISGLGINPWPTFDYNVASMLKDPLITPLFSIVNMFAGQALLIFIIPALWYTNTWQSGYLGINDNGVFDRFGKRYNVSRILDPITQSLNKTAYEEYSPTYLSAGNGIQYGFFFAMYTSVIVYVALHYHKELIGGFRSALTLKSGRKEYNDLHNRLMGAYKEVPEWWYLTIVLFSLATGIAYNIKYETGYPVWALFAALIMSSIFVIPCGIVFAVTNVEVTMNVLAELIGGYALPGKPIAVMLFKSYGFVSTAQAIGYAADLKIGHYAHIGPRHLFFAQMIASVVACFVGVGVISWQISNISDFCHPGQVSRFTCPGYQTYFSASVIWGAIGPKRIYSSGGIYHSLLWFFLIGAVAPIPVWYMAKRKNPGFWRYINVPVFVSGALNWSPYNMSYAIPMLYCSLFMNGYIKRRYFPWWNKYRWVLATALSASIGIFGFIWFFAILFKDSQPDWWGNSVPYAGCDGNSCAWLKVPENGFGPGAGQFRA